MFDGDGNVISADNVVTFKIFSGSEEIDLRNYEIIPSYGKVKITQRNVKLETGSESWIYDGMPHTNTEYVLLEETSLAKGQTVKIVQGSETYITKVGTADNVYKVEVYDSKNSNCTANYVIQIVRKGTLEVTPRYIMIGSESAEKQYDGTPLEKHSVELLEESPNRFPVGHKINAVFSGVITEVGETDNTFDITTVVIYNDIGEDVTYCFEVDTTNYKYGRLVITPDGEGDSVVGSLNTSGKIDGGTDSLSASSSGGKKTAWFTVTANTNGTVYLKVMSFGDYLGDRWARAEEYGSLIFDRASAQYLTAFVLENCGEPLYSIKIVSKNGEYILPYYSMDKNCDIQISDVYVDGNAGDEYYLSFFSWDYQGGYSVTEALKEFEQQYSAFVHEKYLTIDNDTYEYMQGVIQANNFDADDPDIIKKVASYIQNAATYSMHYDRILDQSENVVIDFLEYSKEGICQHFASAATMLYRALGIPARYTIGYVGAVKNGVEVDITDDTAHAWVEVYIDGLGWVYVEVTGGGPGGGNGSGNDDENIERKLEIKPAYMYKEYDGMALTHNGVLEGNKFFDELLNAGYYYTVKVSGSQTEIGECESIITEFILYTPDGTDVTALYDVSMKRGKLRVTKSLVKIYLPQKEYEYSAKSYSYTTQECVVVQIPHGHRFELTYINVSLTNVGKITSESLNTDPSSYFGFKVWDGEEDVTENFDIIIVDYGSGEQYDVLTVKPRLLEITTGSATKAYDREALENKTYYVSNGYVSPSHWVYIEVTGKQIEKASSLNYVKGDSFRVFDENFNDVTSNYTITLEDGSLNVKLGTLTVT